VRSPDLAAWLALGVMTVGACTDEPASVAVEYVRSRPGNAGQLVGVDSDRAGGLWVAYREDTSTDYYRDAAVRIEHVDAAGALVSSFQYTDTFTLVAGIAFTGDALWVNHNGSFTNDNRVRAFDPSTGEALTAFAMEVGLVDLCSRGDQLIVSNLWNQIAGFERVRGGELWRAEVATLPDGGTQRGIAVADDGTWILVQETDSIYRVDDLGSISAVGKLPGSQSTYYDVTDMITWDGDQLVVVHDNSLHWFEVTR
jgi:hypothetical protein